MRHKRQASRSIGIDLDSAALANFADMIPGLTLIHANALDWLESNAASLGPHDLIYADPPYLLDTRICQRQIYRYEMYTEQEHTHLLDLLTGLNCMVVISGYYSDLYATRLEYWRAVQFQAQTRSGKPATEWLWMNYQEPSALHDYRYLGANYRERERIKRQQTRWKKRLERMNSQERYAMLSVIEELHWTTAPEMAVQAAITATINDSAAQILPNEIAMQALDSVIAYYQRHPYAPGTVSPELTVYAGTQRHK